MLQEDKHNTLDRITNTILHEPQNANIPRSSKNHSFSATQAKILRWVMVVIALLFIGFALYSWLG